MSITAVPRVPGLPVSTREYVTEISSPVSEPPELQVLHKLPMTEPQMKTEETDMSKLADVQAPEQDADAPVPYTLTPVGEAVAAHPDTWNRDLWMALDAGEQPGPEAQREARRQSNAEAWEGRGVMASHPEPELEAGQ